MPCCMDDGLFPYCAFPTLIRYFSPPPCYLFHPRGYFFTPLQRFMLGIQRQSASYFLAQGVGNWSDNPDVTGFFKIDTKWFEVISLRVEIPTAKEKHWMCIRWLKWVFSTRSEWKRMVDPITLKPTRATRWNLRWCLPEASMFSARGAVIYALESFHEVSEGKAGGRLLKDRWAGNIAWLVVKRAFSFVIAAGEWRKACTNSQSSDSQRWRRLLWGHSV